MSAIKESLYQTIDQLNEGELLQVLEFAHKINKASEISQIKTSLANDPDIKVPADNSFRKVEPVCGKGVSASELLLRDRK